MKIFLAASSSFWDRLPEVKKKLENLGHFKIVRKELVNGAMLFIY